jgi:hypothetical protein
MPTLADALIEKTKENIDSLEGDDGRVSKEAVKEFAMAFSTLHPASIKAVKIGSSYMQEFAELIGAEDQAYKLHPFVTVTAAALGMQAIWNQILWTWANTPELDVNEEYHPDVLLQIETLIPNFVALIAREHAPPAGPPP